jgi:branched-chain amino acid transport system ATP-binding protein
MTTAMPNIEPNISADTSANQKGHSAQSNFTQDDAEYLPHEPIETAALAVEGLVGGYGPTTILHGTTFTVRRAALTTVIGPNGAGKSTVFKAIFGMIKLREGRVMINGRNIVGLDQAELLRSGVAYVPQGRNLFPQLTVRSNLEFGGVPLKDLKLTRERMEKVFELFPILREKSSLQAGSLSGGQQKMLEVGRSMLLEPKVLLIDEPSIGLSPILVQQVFDLLLRLRTEGVTILMIEQNAKKALAISDEGIVLQQGRLALQGRASTLLNHPDIAQVFLGGHGGAQATSALTSS